MRHKSTLILFTLLVSYTSFAQIKFTDLMIDTSITGFHFAADFGGTQMFTKNGPADLKAVNPSAFLFSIAPNLDAKTALGQLEQLLKMSKENGYTISNIVKKDTTLNGNTAYYTSYTETEKGTTYKNYVFNAFVIKDKTIIIFASGDLDKGKFTEKFKRTFYSIKL
jgi:hypothetical protein